MAPFGVPWRARGGAGTGAARGAWPRLTGLGVGTGATSARRSPAPSSDQPPAGFYDTSIDAQVRASGRGLADLMAAQTMGAARGAFDYNTARGDLFRQRDESLSDLQRDYGRQGQQFDWQRADLDLGFGRGMEDSQVGEGRLREDYGTSVQNLQRNYQRLGGNQAQAFSQAGLSGGAFAQAAAKRSENQAIDRQPLDTNFNRGLTDLLSSRQRMTDDYGTNTGRLGQQRSWMDEDFGTNSRRIGAAADRQAGQLDLGWQRQNQDWQTEREVAQRENRLFGEDANALRWQQARQAGYVAPARPRRRGRR